MKGKILTDSTRNIFQENWQSIVATIIVILIVIVIAVIAVIMAHRVEKNNKGQAAQLAKKIQNYVINFSVLTGMFIILGLWTVNVFPFYVAIVILSLIFGLAMQNNIKDMFAGMNIVFEKYYQIGDSIEINGFKGVVKNITLKTTTILSWQGQIKVIANRKVTEVVNYSKEPSVGYVDVIISHDANIDKALDLLVDNLNKINETYPQVVEGPNVLGVVDLTSQGTTIRIIVKTDPTENGTVERGIRKFVKELFDKNEIEFARNKE